ncbi:hypothetical protein Phum_PHUM407280 [Pediculus humanus corporis]|uniref:glycogenin glucosyltransferase n=1 Tax=Pediculus humanus subsp. corporis TaxID=121224 RepID=E0VRY7_PEDHC|nr:uncharacterized protein Phum_PHUM407280 [Pediculus humanus corporis]EEB16143.1 hypothetical protein Phum_PHUM407280 [Pediculus humanus corporis]
MNFVSTGGYAWVTLATNDSYSLGALVLAHSLKKSNTCHKLAVLITPAVSQPMREQLQTVFDVVKTVDVLDSKDEAHLALLQRPELGVTFTKIHCWRMTEFEKCVFLDADTLVVRNCDELFEREEFSAAPDVSWPDCFNSGVFVYKPSMETFNKLLQFAVERGSFDGGDQGLLNQFFSDWATEDIKKHLPFVYNLTTVAAYSYVPAFKQFGSDTRIVHFIGTGKPWLQQLDPTTKKITPTPGSEHLTSLLQKWWDLFCEKVHPNLNKGLDVANGMLHLPLEACSNSFPVDCNDESRNRNFYEPPVSYREINDCRQINLPYQPFVVKGSSGEFLNIEGFINSIKQQQQQQHEENVEEKEDGNLDERDKEQQQNIDSNHYYYHHQSSENHYNAADSNNSENHSNGETNNNEEQNKENLENVSSNAWENENYEKSPFDYDTFYPDIICINNYLEQNILKYKPFDFCYRNGKYYYISNNNNNKYNLINYNYLDDSDEFERKMLPRFLTIPENDKRQSGNRGFFYKFWQTFGKREKNKFPPGDDTQWKPENYYYYSFLNDNNKKYLLHKSKSLSHLSVGEYSNFISENQSSSFDVSDDNKKYSMPKLKPLLPRRDSFQSNPSVHPKVTHYTEFLISSEYKDPENLPKDNVGFVENHILKQRELKRSKSDADILNKFGPLPYGSTTERERKPVAAPAVVVVRKKELQKHDLQIYDIKNCMRQMGNKPKISDDSITTTMRKRNFTTQKSALPKNSGNFQKKKYPRKPLFTLGGDDEKREKYKKDSKIWKKLKKERKHGGGVGVGGGGSLSTFFESNQNVQANNVNVILDRLFEYSKNYLHYFEEVNKKNCRKSKIVEKKSESDKERKENGTCENLLVMTELLKKSGKDSAKPNIEFDKVSKSSERSKNNENGECLTTNGVEKSETNKNGGTHVKNDKFKNFKNYIQGQFESAQKGFTEILEIADNGVNEDKKQNILFKKGKTNENVRLISYRNALCCKGKDQEESVDVSDDEIKFTAETFPVTPLPLTNGRFNPMEEMLSEYDYEISGALRASSSKSPTKLGKGKRNGEITEDKNNDVKKNGFEKKVENSDNYRKVNGDVNRGNKHTKTINGIDAVENSIIDRNHIVNVEENQNKKKTWNVGYKSEKSGKFHVNKVESAANVKRTSSKSVTTNGPLGKNCHFKKGINNKFEILSMDSPEGTVNFTKGKTHTGRKGPRKPGKNLLATTTNRIADDISQNDESNGNDLKGGNNRLEEDSNFDVSISNLRNNRRAGDVRSKSGIAGAIAQLSLESGGDSNSTAAASSAHQEYIRRQNWETGNMDYMGKDSFDNIWSKICQTIEDKVKVQIKKKVIYNNNKK